MVTGAAVLVAGAAVGLAIVLHLDRRYGPLERGSFGGQYATTGFVDGPDGFTYRLSRAPGATGQLIESLRNDGAHSVEVTGVLPDRIVTEVRWSPWVPPANGGNILGKDLGWRRFPATVPAGGTIKLLVTIHSPDYCDREPPGVALTYTGLRGVRWRSLLHDHVTELDGVFDETGIAVC